MKGVQYEEDETLVRKVVGGTIYNAVWDNRVRKWLNNMQDTNPNERLMSITVKRDQLLYTDAFTCADAPKVYEMLTNQIKYVIYM